MDAIAIFLYLFGVITFVVSIIKDGPNRKALASEADHTGTKNPQRIYRALVLFGAILSAWALNAIRDDLDSLGSWALILSYLGVILFLVLVIRAIWKFLSPESFLRYKANQKLMNEKLWRSLFGGGLCLLFVGAAFFLEEFEHQRNFSEAFSEAVVWGLLGLFLFWEGFNGRRRSRESENLQPT